MAAETGIVPDITPVVALIDSPVGNAPLLTVKVSGATPPDVDIPVVIDPTEIPGRLVERICTAAAGFVPIDPVKFHDWT